MSLLMEKVEVEARLEREARISIVEEAAPPCVGGGNGNGGGGGGGGGGLDGDDGHGDDFGSRR